MVRLAFATVVVLALWSAEVSAQCATEGELNPNNECEICRSGMYESLPERTACAMERRVQCSGGRVFRRECMPNPNDPTGPNVCGDHERFGDACPNGFQCEAGYCITTCTSDDGCQAGFLCNTATSTCEPEPGADMGPEPQDMDSPPPDDMSMGADMTMLRPDGGIPFNNDNGGTPDQGGEPTPDAGGLKPSNDGGCCAVVHPRSGGWFAWIALVGFVLRRRRA